MIPTNIWWAAGATLCVGLLLSCGERSTSFSTLYAATDCTGDVTIREAGTRVLTDQASLESEWQGSIQNPSNTPTVDFGKSVVAVAHAGPKPNCGWSISISGVRERNSEGVAEVEIEVSIRGGMACEGNDSETYPVAFAEIPKMDKRYVFTTKMIGCGS
jgi:hypothetical protein